MTATRDSGIGGHVARRVALGILCAVALGHGAALSGERSGLGGVWQTQPRDDGAFLSVQIGPCDMDPGVVCGTVVGSHNGARTEFVGDRILVGMRPAGNGAWDGGEIIRPGRGTRYASSLRLIDGGLEVKGCVAGGLFCGAQVWTRP